MNKSVFLVFLSAVLFAFGGLCFKIITWDPLAINSARSLLAGTFLFIYLLLRKHVFVINRTTVIAALAISCTNILYAFSNKLTTAGNAIVLQFSMPVFVILIMLVFFHKKPTKLEILTCFSVLAGILFFFIDSLSAGNATGNILSLISGISYAVYFVFISMEKSDPFSAAIFSYIISTVIGMPSLIKTDFKGTELKVFIAVAALGLLQQGTAQICFSSGIKGTSPVAASLISGIEPILNPVLVAVFYHEILTPLSLAGAAIVLISVTGYNYLDSKNKMRKKE